MTIKLLALIPFFFALTLGVNNSVNAASGAVNADTLKKVEQELNGQDKDIISNDTDNTQ